MGRKKLTIQHAHDLAESKGWECLSTEYIGIHSHLKWRCSEKHEWNACFHNIKNKGTGCPKCAGKAKGSIEECKAFAISKGWECLSDIYINAHLHLKWRCSECKHEWMAIFNNIKSNNSGCPKCYENTMGSIEECKAFAISKGWECLSDTYENNRTNLKWRCEKNHEWNATFNSIKNMGSGCPECFRLSQMGSIEECKAFAISKGWECLSTEYFNCMTHLKWRCSKNHEWDACFDSIKNNGTGCPNCLYKSEAMSRDIIEEEMGYEFPKDRPEFLEGLELDGYCPELNMAFEYNGIQHYEYTPHFHRNGESEFLAQRERDIKKYKICKDLKINLIIIPHQYTYQKPNELKVFITDELLKVS